MMPAEVASDMPASPPATHPESHQAAMCRNGMNIALFVAAALVLPATTITATEASAMNKVRMFIFLMFLILGCAAVLFSPMHRCIASVQHMTTMIAAARTDQVGPDLVRVDRGEAMLRWTGFHVVLGVAPALALAAVTAVTMDKLRLCVLFLALMIGAWLVMLSVVRQMIPRAVRPAADAVAHEIDGVLFGGHIGESDLM